ncbi:hypothetical protein DAMA08_050870 [Martiniozyma asiatica (nom. inval.)]|nr:hypothetical protein DAMA08_050870 [Martiniozyma asiatica]
MTLEPLGEQLLALRYSARRTEYLLRKYIDPNKLICKPGRYRAAREGSVASLKSSFTQIELLFDDKAQSVNEGLNVENEMVGQDKDNADSKGAEALANGSQLKRNWDVNFNNTNSLNSIAQFKRAKNSPLNSERDILDISSDLIIEESTQIEIGEIFISDDYIRTSSPVHAHDETTLLERSQLLSSFNPIFDSD